MATREEQRREYNEQKELESLRRVFDTLDKDKNNKIDFKEVSPRHTMECTPHQAVMAALYICHTLTRRLATRSSTRCWSSWTTRRKGKRWRT